MPEEFVLEVKDGEGGWMDWGLYRARDFERQPDGAYLCAGEGSPLWLRCLHSDRDLVRRERSGRCCFPCEAAALRVASALDEKQQSRFAWNATAHADAVPLFAKLNGHATRRPAASVRGVTS